VSGMKVERLEFYLPLNLLQANSLKIPEIFKLFYFLQVLPKK
jgi:hypothetical protein